MYNSSMQIFADKIFENPIEIIEAFDRESFFEAFSRIEILRKCPNVYLLGYIRYEAKEIFLGDEIKTHEPLLYFEVFDKAKCKMESAKCYSTYLNSATSAPPGSLASPQLSGSLCQLIDLSTHQLTGYEAYENKINRIKEEIACGNTYQVNYTYGWKIETNLGGLDLYNSILPNQITPYNAYIKNRYEEILCFSPELFFELKGNNIMTKPMKGTVKRGENEKEDLENIEFLKNDIKNRAENVMIVDLLRNDLGKIAKTGSVKVDKLFEVETHNTVHQMTSEVSAEFEDKTLLDIFEAIFPCGSITGAPKINTMKIIDELEEGKRDVYCGAIGLISKEKTVFSVPIRTLQKKNNQDFFTCRVGGAIVWDSTPEDEWEETLTKIKFLQPDFKIVETILMKDGELQFAQQHFDRMKKSAQEFGFVFNEDILKFQSEKDCILRILLDKQGDFETQVLPLDELKSNKIEVSKSPINSKEKMLYHKTTYRPWYEASMKKIKAGEIFDEIFFNEKGELTEGARSNIVLQINGELFTSSVECGLLNGVMRQELLNQNKIKEKVLYLEDLQKAEKIFCVNSVRGIVEVLVK